VPADSALGDLSTWGGRDTSSRPLEDDWFDAQIQGRTLSKLPQKAARSSAMSHGAGGVEVDGQRGAERASGGGRQGGSGTQGETAGGGQNERATGKEGGVARNTVQDNDKAAVKARRQRAKERENEAFMARLKERAWKGTNVGGGGGGGKGEG